MKLKILTILIISILSNKMIAQKLKNNIFQDENSATTENKMNVAKLNIDKAFIAYSENNIEKSKYFIDQSQRQGIKTGDFYFLLGAYMYRTEEYKAAKRYWKIAFKEGGCWECKDLLEALDKNQLTNEMILKKVNSYLEKK